MNENRVGKPPPSRLKALLGSRFGAFSEQILLGPAPVWMRLFWTLKTAG